MANKLKLFSCRLEIDMILKVIATAILGIAFVVTQSCAAALAVTTQCLGYRVGLYPVYSQSSADTLVYYIPPPNPVFGNSNAANAVTVTDFGMRIVPGGSLPSSGAQISQHLILTITFTYNGSTRVLRAVALKLPAAPSQMPSYQFSFASLGIPLSQTMRTYTSLQVPQDTVQVTGVGIAKYSPEVFVTYTWPTTVATALSADCSGFGAEVLSGSQEPYSALQLHQP